MNRIILVLAAACVYGCAATGKKLDGPIESIGIFVNIRGNSLCYASQGITRFGNTLNSYEFKENFQSLVISSIDDAVDSENIDVTYLDPEKIEAHGHFAEKLQWNGSIRLIDEHKERFTGLYFPLWF